MNNSLSSRRSDNWARRWTKRNRQQKKYHPLDGHSRIRLTPYLPSFAKLLVVFIAVILLIELIACVAVLHIILTTGAK